MCRTHLHTFTQTELWMTLMYKENSRTVIWAFVYLWPHITKAQKTLSGLWATETNERACDQTNDRPTHQPPHQPSNRITESKFLLKGCVHARMYVYVWLYVCMRIVIFSWATNDLFYLYSSLLLGTTDMATLISPFSSTDRFHLQQQQHQQ